jgi:hypothetical protein
MLGLSLAVIFAAGAVFGAALALLAQTKAAWRERRIPVRADVVRGEYMPPG